MVFLFDEPASNLHQTAQKALLRSVRELAEHAVVIYTTHSHHLIEPEWLGTTFVVINRGVDPSVVSAESAARATDIIAVPYRQFAASNPKQSQYFQPILDVLDYAPSKLEMVPAVVMTEGKTDFYLLSYFQTVIFDIPERKRLAFMPGGGAGSLTEPMRLYLSWGRPFVALLDSDPAGRREATRYSGLFGRIVDGRLLDLATLSGKPEVRGMESLLPEQDRLKIQRIGDPASTTGNKDAFARGLQEALLTGQRVAISATGKRRVEKVTEGLRQALETAKSEGPG
jgi:hypothetical protein